MIASLPMYDRPETAAANDRLWFQICENLGWPHAPLLRENQPESHWRRPDLAISQTCGLPYRAGLHSDVSYVGTPDYALPGCPPGYYNSVIVVRADSGLKTLYELDGAAMAVNATTSQSGWAAPINIGLKPGRIVVTGAHVASAKAVADGDATFAALDAQTWRMMQRWDDMADTLIVLERTPPTPGLPLITARHGEVSAIKGAVQAALSSMCEADKHTLGMTSLVQIPKDAYLSIPTPDPI